jgi:hypothetical protein
MVFLLLGIYYLIGLLVLEVFAQYSGIILKIQEEFFLDTLILDDESSSLAWNIKIWVPIDAATYTRCMYLHMSIKHNVHVNILILYKATCFDFQEVNIRPLSEHKNIKLQCWSARFYVLRKAWRWLLESWNM